MIIRIKRWFIVRWLEREHRTLTSYSRKALCGYSGHVSIEAFRSLSYRLRKYAAVGELCRGRLDSIKLHTVIDALLSNVPTTVQILVEATHLGTMDDIKCQLTRLNRKCELMKLAIKDYFQIIALVEAHCETNECYHDLVAVMEDYRQAVYQLDGYLAHIQNCCKDLESSTVPVCSEA